MPDLEFFWDPVCPWAWLTSRWVVNVIAERPMTVEWKFICLRIVNEAKDYEKDFPPGYERGHTRGLEMLRVAAAVRDQLGNDAVLPLYTGYGRIMHVQRNREAFDDPSGIRGVLAGLGYPLSLADVAYGTDFDPVLREETQDALDRCGGNIGTPVLSFTPPTGPSFFGPVICKAPKGKEAVELWDAVVALGSNPWFSELKRSTRGKPQLDTSED